MSNKEDCGICCEFINKSNRKKIVCPNDKCALLCCRMCFVTHLMSSGVNPACMQCKKDFSSDFLMENITQKQYKDYTDYTTELLIEVIKGQLPEWQDEANRILVDRRFTALYDEKYSELLAVNSNISSIKKSLENIYSKSGINRINPFKKFSHYSDSLYVIRFLLDIWNTDYNCICSLCDKHVYNTINIYTCRCGFKKCNHCVSFCVLLNDTKCVCCEEDEFTLEQIKEITSKTYFNKFFKSKKQTENKLEIDKHKNTGVSLIKQKIDVNTTFTDIAFEFQKLKSVMHEPDKKEKVARFIKKCPNNDCRGFLSTAWKCGLCADFFCSDCHVKKNGARDENHVCNEAEKETVAMLKKDTKPCPRCGTPIDRYTGCNQVWTPCCKIAFDWSTGKIVTNERIHSPEYYDYMRRTNNGIVPREVGDNQCGERVNEYDFSNSLWDNKLNRYTLNAQKCMDYYRLTEHVNAVQIPLLPYNLGEIDYSKLGVKYLIGDIDDIKWKKSLKTDIKREKRENEVYHILNMFVNVMEDLSHDIINDKNTVKFIDSADSLIKYVNEQIGKINKKYKSVEKKYFISV